MTALNYESPRTPKASRAMLLMHGVCLLPLVCVVMPHIYFAVRWIFGTPWPSAVVSDPAIDGVPAAIQFSWLLGMLIALLMLPLVTVLAAARVVRWSHLITSFMALSIGLIWVCLDLGGVFFYLDD